ncbi:MAG: hypothetical protein KDD70_03060, partial [Bdellovibrionales bacterium]|nr:hypothetical protein [Bdellovibrionales bacterium]
GSCSRCLSNCPTKAFPNPYELDARRCISFLTIEKRGAFTDWESSSIGEWVFGCDICQEVCPFNAARSKEDSFEVWKELRGGELQIELGALFELRTEEEFRERFRGSPITRTGREGLLRNALCVIGNTQAEGVFSQIADRAFDDSSAVVRGEAERTAKKLKNQQLEQTYLKVL